MSNCLKCKAHCEDAGKHYVTADLCPSFEPKPNTRYILFVLDGCDISFVATAPEDITLKQLLEQCDKIKPNYCACGIRPFYRGIDLDHTYYPPDLSPAEIVIGYDNIQKVSDDVPCQIVEHWRDKTYQWDGEIKEAEGEK